MDPAGNTELNQMATGQPLALVLRGPAIESVFLCYNGLTSPGIKIRRKYQTTANGNLMHGCLMPSLFSQGELLILAATHKLCQDLRTKNTKKASSNAESCQSERKSFGRMQAGGGIVCSCNCGFIPTWRECKVGMWQISRLGI
jgi:hypothetical protein